LDVGDWSAASIGNDPGIMIHALRPRVPVGYVSIDITAAMQDDLNNHRAYATFMIKESIDTDGDGKGDGWGFYAWENPPSVKPYVEYSVRIATVPTVTVPWTALLFTDWALSNPTLSPPSPREGDPVTFSAVLQVLSTTPSYPLTVNVVALLDGVTIAGGSVNYLGPDRLPMTVHSTTPWTAMEGAHTITWVADPSPYAYNDLNRANNEASLTFTVGAGAAPVAWDLFVTPESVKVAPGDSTMFAVQVTGESGATSIQLI
jgi:hypothetical protein